ncbi:MAG: hypothetical protein ACYDBV_09795 [Nitrospiria bacterium]
MAPSLANLTVTYFPFLKTAVAVEHKNNPLPSKIAEGQIRCVNIFPGFDKERLEVKKRTGITLSDLKLQTIIRRHPGRYLLFESIRR